MKKYLLSLVLFTTLFCHAEQPLSLDNVYMNVVKTDASGVVNHETIFHFCQSDHVIKAEYAGGKIQQGYLVGKFDEHNHLLFSYCQMQLDGKLDNGTSECEVSRDQDGKILLIEHFEWASRPGEMGTNIFKEL
jgi:hypothetical protein